MAIVPLALGLLVGVGVAVLPSSAALGVLGALLIGVFGLQVQFLVMAEKADVDAQMMLRRLQPIVDIAERDQDAADFLLDLANAQTEFSKSTPGLPIVFADELAHQRRRLLDRYEECCQGRMSISLSARPILRETDGVSAVRERLWATSLVPPVSYWDVQTGRIYLKQQENMLRAGKVIRRIFIQPEDKLGDLRHVVSTHLRWRAEFGVDLSDVRVVLLDGSLDEELVVDFAIVDRSTVIRLATAHGIDHPVAVVWDASSASVSSYSGRFERLWNCGVDPIELEMFQSDEKAKNWTV
jgi:hypothetical protein